MREGLDISLRAGRGARYPHKIEKKIKSDSNILKG
jgi:hypothetical protein